MIKIAIVVGHRSKARGAFGNAGLSEFGFNSLVAEALSDGFIGHDKVEVKVFFRDNKRDGYGEKMKRLHKRIDEWGADYSLSLHFNAAGREDVTGHEILYCSKKGKKLAKKLDEIFDKYLKNRDRNIKKRTKKQRGGGFLCRGESICVLAEPFFASHQNLYMPGGSGWFALIGAYSEFIEWLGERSEVGS